MEWKALGAKVSCEGTVWSVPTQKVALVHGGDVGEDGEDGAHGRLRAARRMGRIGMMGGMGRAHKQKHQPVQSSYQKQLKT